MKPIFISTYTKYFTDSEVLDFFAGTMRERCMGKYLCYSPRTNYYTTSNTIIPNPEYEEFHETREGFEQAINIFKLIDLL